MNIYIAIHKYGDDYSDEAYFFESEDTLAELVKKKLDIVPELKDNKIYENNKKYHRTRMIRYSSTGRT